MSTQDLELEIVESLSEEMRKIIDFEVIAKIMVGMNGYTRLDIKYSQHKRWVDVLIWADTTCTGKYKEHAGIWLFERPEDAVMFKLKWA